jgi:hypothetical protein
LTSFWKLFYAPDKIALHSLKLLCVESRFELPDISNPRTPHVDASGVLSMPVDEPHGPQTPCKQTRHLGGWWENRAGSNHTFDPAPELHWTLIPSPL